MKERTLSHLSWNTEKEISFVQGLGTFGVVGGKDRLELLQKYWNSMDNRKNWAGIDKEQVRKVVEFEILAMKGLMYNIEGKTRIGG